MPTQMPVRYFYRKGGGAGQPPQLMISPSPNVPYGYQEVNEQQARNYIAEQERAGAKLDPSGSNYYTQAAGERYPTVGLQVSGKEYLTGGGQQYLAQGSQPGTSFVPVQQEAEYLANEAAVKAGTMIKSGAPGAELYTPVGSAAQLQQQGVPIEQQLKTPSVQAQIQQQGLTPVVPQQPTPQPQVLGSQGTTPPVPTPTPAGQTYTIQAGDTLSALAAKNNTTVAALMAANPQITDPNKIYAGATLNIPGASAAPGTPPSPIPPPKIPTPEEALAMTDDQKTQTIKDLAAAGVDWKTIQSYMDAITTPSKTAEEIKKEMYDKYGISDLEAKFKAKPTETFEDIYKRVSESLNLSDLKTKIADIVAKIDKADADYATATGNINVNPWVSESGRVGKIAKLTTDYNLTRTRLDNQRVLLENMLDRGKTEAENTATRVLAEFDKTREWTKEELDYYLKRAQADLDAELALQEEKQQKELWRYYPEFAKYYTEAGKLKENIIEVQGGLWDLEKSKWIIQPKAETTKITDTDRVNQISQFMISKMGTDGFISADTYVETQQKWIGMGGTITDFRAAFPPESVMGEWELPKLPSSIWKATKTGTTNEDIIK